MLKVLSFIDFLILKDLRCIECYLRMLTLKKINLLAITVSVIDILTWNYLIVFCIKDGQKSIRLSNVELSYDF